MSSRALRKAQREREEQEKLHKLEITEQDESDESDVPQPSVQRSAFAMLGEADDDDSANAEDDDDPEVEDTDGGVQLPATPPVKLSSTPASKKKKKSKQKKKKTKASDSKPSDDSRGDDKDLDEIDRALQQLSANGDSSKAGETVAGSSQKTNEVAKLLSIDTNHLHAQNEMRRLFGRAALDQRDEEQAPAPANIGGNRRQQRRVQQVGLAQALRGQGAAGGRSGGLAAMALRRNIFIQGKEDWPIATGGGLGMEVEEKRGDGTWMYKFVHNRIYQDVQMQFEMAVESMDPNQLIALLQHNPYHISCLLQVSEIAKQERDHATAGDLLERALFSFGRAVHSTFVKSLGEGKARLDFRRMENREFWLASWRYMQNLSMRATWRTVYEWAKLLLSLSPEDDPYAIWLVLDQYALRCRQDLDYLNISRDPTFKAIHEDMPNIQLSQGLAEFRSGNASKGRQSLYTAVGRFPWVAARLMQELQLDLPPSIWGREPRTEREKLHAELYATRAKDLWTTPEASTLLLEVTSALPPDTPPADIDHSAISTAEARHVVLSDTPALIALIPRSFTTRLVSSSDPLPPDDAEPSYLATLPRVSRSEATSSSTSNRPPSTRAEDLTELHGLYNFFSRFFPWFQNGGTGGAQAEGEEGGVPFTEEEVERRIRESGVDEEVIARRTARMMELQRRLGGVGDEAPQVEEEEGEEEVEVEEGDRRARVEDGVEEGD